MPVIDQKFDQLAKHMAEEVIMWSGGINKPWAGLAALDPQELANLISLASHAPQTEINKFLRGEQLANITKEKD